MGSLSFRDELWRELLAFANGRTDFRLNLENAANVNLDNDETPVVMVQIVYSGSEQSDLNPQPMQRDDGSVLVTVLVRGHSGTRKAFELRDELASVLQRKEFGGARTSVASRVGNTSEFKGWVGYRLAVPFWHYYLIK